jgi:hypothetical protein
VAYLRHFANIFLAVNVASYSRETVFRTKFESHNSGEIIPNLRPRVHLQKKAGYGNAFLLSAIPFTKGGASADIAHSEPYAKIHTKLQRSVNHH